MISNKITFVPIDQIIFEPDERRPINEDHVVELAESIQNTDLIHIPVVDEELRICAGGHRFRAWQKLLADNAPCPNPSYKKWALFPVRIVSDFSEEAIAQIELVENLQHRKLSWKETVAGIVKLHKMYLATDPDWTAVRTSKILSVASSTVSRAIVIEPFLSDPIISKCDSMGAAWNIVQRRHQRQKANELESILTRPSVQATLAKVVDGKEPDKPLEQLQEDEQRNETETPSPKKVKPASSPSPILNESFLEWAPKYSGPRFNFLHCDFPYGINLTDSAGQKTAKDSFYYDDSPETYWNLLSCLADNQQRFIASSSHIMFWFSQNLQRETEDFFAARMPNFSLEPFLMIWHKTDNAGLLPDPQRYGRRNYETAFLLTSGDRKLVRPKALCFGYSSKRDDKIHRSQKPLEVLTHFMSMFVDDSSKVLDPTCGSGTSIRVASSLGASSFLGLEIDKDMTKQAIKLFKRQKIH